jgi:hypothetical protein
VIPYITDFIWTTKNWPDIKSVPPPYDVDNQNLELSLSCDGCPLPSSLINPELWNLSSPSILFHMVTSYLEYGSYKIQVSVSDSIDITSFSFILKVKNAPPTINVKTDLIKAFAIPKDFEPVIYELNLNDYFEKADSDMDTDAADFAGDF